MKLIAIFILIFPLILFAQEKQGLLNKLLAPGPLIEGHSNLEKSECLSCHDTGNGVPNNLCLNCHKEIKQSIDRKNTFHGLIAKKNCIECHGDHQGRNFDTTKLDTKKFEHQKTGYPLVGKHKGIKCIDCHKETRIKMAVRKEDVRYIGLAIGCQKCHQKQDVHFFKDEFAKKDCNSCHNELKWKDVKNFDHFKASNYKLEGKHKDLSCAKCHMPNGEKIEPSLYKWPNLKEQNCLSCHKPFHKNNLSEKFTDNKCERCHDQNSWKIPKFNHQITGFALKEKHLETTCVKCHKATEGAKEDDVYKLFTGTVKVVNHNWTGLKASCKTCHKDIHLFGAQFSKRFNKLENCQTCHNERSFKIGTNFNHGLDTRFKIDGKHSPLACIKCHINSDVTNIESDRVYHFKDLEKDNCIICHKSPHLATFSEKNLAKRCASCHSTQSWQEIRKNENFNHNLDTNFILDGKHLKMDCKTCHNEKEKKIFKFENREKQFCVTCHDNVHNNQFSEKFSNKSCLSCHNTDSFKILKVFDHNLTNFKLTGKHIDPNVNCNSCHKPTSELMQYKGKSIKLKNNFKFIDDQKGMCKTCHTNVHINQFNFETTQKACTTCHTTDTFHERKNFEHGITRFVLLGLHEKVDCNKCHKPTGVFFNTEKKERPMHKFMFDNPRTENCKTCHIDAHKGEYGSSCKECHDEKNKWKSTQKFHINFTLSGTHYTLKCNECHKDQRRLGGMSDNCQMCHQKDDRHHGTLPNCKECHRQEFWEVTTFKHSRTAFPLRGIHRTLSCDSCHKNGMYQGKSSDCISCHYADKNKSTSVSHNIAGFETCSQCHNQMSFK